MALETDDTSAALRDVASAGEMVGLWATKESTLVAWMADVTVLRKVWPLDSMAFASADL